MRKLYFILLFFFFASFCYANTGCYVYLAKQGIDDNTIYTQIGPSGSFEYAGLQFHPSPSQCFETLITPCYINREPEPYFPNGPQYDSGYMVSFTPDLACSFDGLLIIPLAIALILVYYRFRNN